MKQDANGRWVRAEPEALGPNRGFGGYYRSADRVVDGKVFRGVPLKTAEDAVVAAVQMGYRVVDEQIERGMRAAQRLRGAAERTGQGDPGQMLDAGERLANNAAMAGLQWIESLSADPTNPLRRLLAAEYRMLMDLMGLQREQGRHAAQRGQHAPGSAFGEGFGARGDGAAQASANDDGLHAAHGAPNPGARRAPRVRIIHDPGSARRAVTLRVWDVDREAIEGELELVFFLLDASAPRKLAAAYVSQDGESAVLRLSTREDDPAGRWRAAVCSEQGEQLGLIEIEL